ncbi:MAG: nucleoside triphosphate pyrophosphohydrolase [Oligoflexales bacterium]
MKEEKPSRAFDEFVATIAALRHPKTGCPWDLKQSHETLRKYMIEEAYEAAIAMGNGETAEIVDELGDVLLQVVLNAQIGADNNKFSVTDVIQNINDKMVRRHPHVFAESNDAIKTPTDVKRQWEEIKAVENKGAASSVQNSVKGFPASLQAAMIGKFSSKVDFDWKDSNEVFNHFRSEVDELTVEMKKKERSKELLADELGDVFFTLVQLCRHLDIDPETSFLAANQKFIRRFEKMQEAAGKKNKLFADLSRSEKEDLWNAVKKGK